MQKILIYDTETTGLVPSERSRFDKINSYPRLLQISAILYNENGEKLREINFYVHHKDLVINNSHIHKITSDLTEKEGHSIKYVLEQFEEICSEADLIVCHNYAFDSSIVLSELRRNKIHDFLTKIPSFCTMTECSGVSRAISLQNLHHSLFGSYFSNHHNSLYDTEATANCFFKMIELGWLEKRDNTYHFTKEPETVEFDLDPENLKFYNAFSIISESRKNIFLTGKAGTGKTTFLKYLRQKTSKVNITLAYTGVAAINAGGQTINSFFQLDFRPFLPDDSSLNKENIYGFLKYTSNKLELIKKLDILIIDEVSMVKADTIDTIDKILRIYRKKESLPFGGVQMIFIGDLFQLPPIEGNEWKIISEFYKSPYFFDSRIIQSLTENNNLVCIELDKVYRQTELEFIDILNRVRIGKQSAYDLNKLNQNRFNAENMNRLLSDNYIVLTTTNARVNAINDSKLEEIENPVFSYSGITEGDFPDSMKIAPQLLTLKVDAQVMLLKNSGRNYNGKIGTVVKLEEDFIEVVFDGENMPISIDKAVWENIEYSYNKEKHKIEENIKGSHTQFPLKLAWAVTVHKSQGLTFNKVIADVSKAFTAGQVYVALSRCTSLSTLKLVGSLPNDAIIIDHRVVNFAKIQTPDTIIKDFIVEGKTDTLYSSFRILLFDEKADQAFEELEEVYKHQNDIFSSAFMSSLQPHFKKYKNYQYSIKALSRTAIGMRNEDEEDHAYPEQSSHENTLLNENFNRFENALLSLREEVKNTLLTLEILRDENSRYLAGKGSIDSNLKLVIAAYSDKYKEFDEVDTELKTLKAKWLS